MSVNLLDSIVNSFGPSVIDRIGQRLGLSSAVVKAATPMVVGLVLSGLKRVMGESGGEDAAHSLLKSGRDMLGDRGLETFLADADPAHAASLLDMLTGSNSIENVAANFAHKSGLDPAINPEVAGKMIGMMAPAVLGRVSQFAADQGLDVKGLGSAIEADSKALASLGDFNDILNDVPGIVDDLKRALSSLFGRG